MPDESKENQALGVTDLPKKPLDAAERERVKGGVRGGKDRTQTEDDVYIGNR